MCASRSLIYFSWIQRNIFSNKNDFFIIKNEMKDKEWCVAENENMPKNLLTYSYLITNQVSNQIKKKLLQLYD